jgi:hypothetical protein
MRSSGIDLGTGTRAPDFGLDTGMDTDLDIGLDIGMDTGFDTGMLELLW